MILLIWWRNKNISLKSSSNQNPKHTKVNQWISQVESEVTFGMRTEMDAQVPFWPSLCRMNEISRVIKMYRCERRGACLLFIGSLFLSLAFFVYKVILALMAKPIYWCNLPLLFLLFPQMWPFFSFLWVWVTHSMCVCTSEWKMHLKNPGHVFFLFFSSYSHVVLFEKSPMFKT